MKRTPMATAASTSAIKWTAVEPETASALRNSPELNRSPCPNPPPTAAYSSSAKPRIRPTVQVRSFDRSASDPNSPRNVSADEAESCLAITRHGRQKSRISPRAMRGSRRTRRGSMKVTKNSASIRAITITPATAATARIALRLRLGQGSKLQNSSRGAARPLDDLALRPRRARRLLLPALRAPDRGRRRAGAGGARGRRGAALPVRLRRDHSARARVLGARPDDRAGAGLLLRDVAALRRARALGPALRRVRPDRPASGRRRPRVARGALEPVLDDAGLRGRRRAPGAGGRRLHRRDSDLPAASRARRRPRRPQRHQVPRRALGRPAG